MGKKLIAPETTFVYSILFDFTALLFQRAHTRACNDKEIGKSYCIYLCLSYRCYRFKIERKTLMRIAVLCVPMHPQTMSVSTS